MQRIGTTQVRHGVLTGPLSILSILFQREQLQEIFDVYARAEGQFLSPLTPTERHFAATPSPDDEFRR